MVSVKELGRESVKEVIDLSLQIFGDAGGDFHSPQVWISYLDNGGLLIGGFEEEKLVGYKFGYKVGDGEFHSWMGGVLESERGKGIAGLLLEYQEGWAKSNGYMRITVNTYQQKYPIMYQFLLKNGYQVVREEERENGLTKSYFEKVL